MCTYIKVYFLFTNIKNSPIICKNMERRTNMCLIKKIQQMKINPPHYSMQTQKNNLIINQKKRY